MLKKYSITTAFMMLFSVACFAQTGNYTVGGTTVNPNVAPYDGTITYPTAGSSMTTGDYNTLIGASAGHSLSSGQQSTFIGTMAGALYDNDSDNIAIGAFAADQATTGVDNVVIGTRAARALNGTDNTVIGVEAGMVMTTGANDNTIIGEEAGQALIDGDDNVFIGEDAGYNTTGPNGSSPSYLGGDNTFVGNASGRSNTTGYRNAFFGNEAGYDNTTGHWNTAVGDSALIDNGVGFNNTAVGHGAGCATEHADYNTFVGSYAGGDNNRTNTTTTANRNTYVGAFAGASNRIGEDNVGMGTYAGFGTGYNLTGVNGQWGWIGNTNRSRTTFMGAQAYANNNDVIVIGYRARIDGRYGVAIGNESNVSNANGAIGLGYQTALSNNGDYSVAVGYQANISENDAVGIGRSVDVDNEHAVAVGANSIVQNNGAIVIGYGANSMDLIDNSGGDPDATNNIAIGYNATTSAFNSVAIGNAASAAIDNTMVLGGATNPLSVGIGTDAPNVLASLTLEDTNKGLLLNRLTTALRTSLGSSLTAAEHGMLVYDTEDKAVYVWDGTQWLSATIDTDDQTVDVFQLNGDNLELSLEADGVATQTVDLSGYLDNTDAQAITLATNTLSITGNAGTVDLSGYLDNTDAQDLSLSGSTLNISNGTGVDLSSLQDGTGTDSQELALASDILSISGGTNTVDLSAYANTDSQNLTAATLTGSVIQIDIENGSSVSVDIAPLIADLENRVTVLEACACGVLLVGEDEIATMRPVLEQNIPNPFDATSAIGYYVPHDVSQADIVFSNNVGQIVDRITITQKGEGEVSVNASGYASGMYYYTLYLDGKKIDTKKMIVN
jgi:hypothetical protein